MFAAGLYIDWICLSFHFGYCISGIDGIIGTYCLAVALQFIKKSVCICRYIFSFSSPLCHVPSVLSLQYSPTHPSRHDAQTDNLSMTIANQTVCVPY